MTVMTPISLSNLLEKWAHIFFCQKLRWTAAYNPISRIPKMTLFHEIKDSYNIFMIEIQKGLVLEKREN